MQRTNSFSIIRWLAVIFVFLAVVLLALQLVSYSRMRDRFPIGQKIAGVPVGGLTHQQASDRLNQAYGIPVEIRYKEAAIQIKPNTAGFQLNIPGMLTAADLQRSSIPFWSGFWDFLWNRLPEPTEVPLLAGVADEQLRIFLKNEVAARYNQPPTAAIPIPGTSTFRAGEPGIQLDIERSIPIIVDALKSASSRVVTLTYSQITPARPSLDNLQILLQQTIDASGYDGLTEIYLYDLTGNQELYFAYEKGENLTPGMAFTAASTIKIPIMVSVYKRVAEPISDDIANLMELMIVRSLNDPADQLMQTTMDINLGPIMVTEDMEAIGLKSTFIAGYFFNGAQLLWRYETPANTRTDYSTDPDVYNQTTAIEMGSLLKDIYQCAELGGGTLMAAFEGEITQSECRIMIETLNRDRIGVLLQAGLPDGTKFAHKHGWTSPPPDYVIKQVADAGIVYSPGGNYVIAVFQYHPVQIVFEPDNQLLADISQAIYNYFNVAAEQ